MYCTPFYSSTIPKQRAAQPQKTSVHSIQLFSLDIYIYSGIYKFLMSTDRNIPLKILPHVPNIKLLKLFDIVNYRLKTES